MTVPRLRLQLASLAPSSSSLRSAPRASSSARGLGRESESGDRDFGGAHSPLAFFEINPFVIGRMDRLGPIRAVAVKEAGANVRGHDLRQTKPRGAGPVREDITNTTLTISAWVTQDSLDE